MSNNNEKKKSKKNKKCKIRCKSCEFFDPQLDYCNEKDIENCSEQTHINFSSCDSYLVREDLVMF